MDLRIAFYVCIALLVILLCAGVSRRPKDSKEFFDRVSVKEIQGFLAVFIIFHHILVIFENKLVEPGAMLFFYFYGIIAVCFFFFCSGFGLIKRWMTDKNYIKHFMKRRIFTTLVPFFICNYIYLTDALIRNIHGNSHFGFDEVICSFFGVFLVNNQMWFAVEIMILYVVFRIVFAKIKKPLPGILIMTATVLVMMVIGFFSGHSVTSVMSYWFKGEWWYNTIFMFPLGMFYAYKEEAINKIIRKGFWIILILSAALFYLLDLLHRSLILRSIYWTEQMNPAHHYFDKLTGLCEETLFEIVFLILVVTILSRVKIGNPVLKFLGKISLEIIMINYLMIEKLFFLYIRYGIGIYLAAVVASTILAASVIYLIKNIVLERRAGLFDGKVT